MNKYLKIILGVVGVILLGIGLLIVAFILDMKPDEEEKVRVQAKQYLAEKFNDNFEVYDTLYDNMGNFGFEYAAKARDKKTNTEFLVYYNDETEQMVDTYVAAKWAKDLENEIGPFMKENLEETTNVHVYFNDEIGNELGIDPVNPRSYKEFDVTPTIRITVPRTRSGGDEKILNELISFLKSKDQLQHGSVIMEYIAENGVILDEEWGKEF